MSTDTPNHRRVWTAFQRYRLARARVVEAAVAWLDGDSPREDLDCALGNAVNGYKFARERFEEAKKHGPAWAGALRTEGSRS